MGCMSVGLKIDFVVVKSPLYRTIVKLYHQLLAIRVSPLVSVFFQCECVCENNQGGWINVQLMARGTMGSTE
jgi:hypothetical protein